MIGPNLERCQHFHLFLLSILATTCFYLVVMSKNRVFDYPGSEKNFFWLSSIAIGSIASLDLQSKVVTTHIQDPQMLR